MRASREAQVARVVSVGRNAAWVAFEGEPELRLASIPKRLTRLALVPGDLVRALPLDEDDERVTIEGLEPRDFVLERKLSDGRTKTMAANIDALVLVAAFDRPPIHLPMVDELLAFAELHEIAAVAIFTKPDLIAPQAAETIRAPYAALGYETHVANPKLGEGIRSLRDSLERRRALLIGQSGVGKSSLYKALGGENLIGDVSKIGRGRQTTTAARLHRFANGFLIDSPGFSEFELQDLSPAEVAHGFVEFRPLAGKCKFTDCTHRMEPACVVRAAAQAGTIAASRYGSYLAILARNG